MYLDRKCSCLKSLLSPEGLLQSPDFASQFADGKNFRDSHGYGLFYVPAAGMRSVQRRFCEEPKRIESASFEAVCLVAHDI